MQVNEIKIAQIASGSWSVIKEPEHETLRTFKLRAHAMVFGRKRAKSLGANIHIVGPDGVGVRHSLTHPSIFA